MKMPWQKTTWESTIKANIVLSISNVVLVILLSICVVHTLTVDKDTILVPGVVDEKMTISTSSANEAYVKSFGLYAATLVANITSANANFITDSISQFLDPSIYPTIRKTILAAAASSSFKEAAEATKFVPRSVTYEPETNKVFVIGDSSVISASLQTGARSIVYELTIHIVNKRPNITTLDTYEGMQPHTLQWVKDHTLQNGTVPGTQQGADDADKTEKTK